MEKNTIEKGVIILCMLNEYVKYEYVTGSMRLGRFYKVYIISINSGVDIAMFVCPSV